MKTENEAADSEVNRKETDNNDIGKELDCKVVEKINSNNQKENTTITKEKSLLIEHQKYFNVMMTVIILLLLLYIAYFLRFNYNFYSDYKKLMRVYRGRYIHHTELNAKYVYLSFFSFHSLFFVLFIVFSVMAYYKTNFDYWDYLFGISSLKLMLVLSMGMINLFDYPYFFFLTLEAYTVFFCRNLVKNITMLELLITKAQLIEENKLENLI